MNKKVSINKQKLNWQPINFLPKIATMVDGMLESAEENLENLSEAKEKPHVMDDYTVGRMFEVYGTQKADFWMYDEQLDRWQKETLTENQQKEISRLQAQMVKLKKVVDQNLLIAEYLKENTIEKVLAKDDAELAMEFLMGKRKP